MAFIGLTGLTGGTLLGPSSGDTYWGRLMEMPEGGTIFKVYARFQSDGGTLNMAAAIFSDNGSNLPNAMLTTDTATAVITTTEDFYEVTLGTPIHLNSGDKFFADAWADGSHYIRYQLGGITNEFFQRWTETYPTFQNPDTNSGNTYSGTEIPWIYVEYTPDAAPGNTTSFFNMF